MRRVLAILLLCLSGGVCAEPAVVVNPGLQQDTISRALLRGIFGMRVRTWSDGTPTRVFVLADDSETHVDFCKAVLKTYPYQLRLAWDRLVYSGTGQPPLEVRDFAEMRARIEQTPGAIGYLPDAEIADGLADLDLKVLNVR